MKCLLAKSVTVTLLLMSVGSIVAAQSANFSRDIQPIFAEHCLQCHGPDADQREADLRLDIEATAKQSVIVAGSPAESELLSRITSADPDDRMPPSEFDSLSSAQIDAIRTWIEDGAKYERHWAFEPTHDVEVPRTPSSNHGSDIDAFVVSKLSQHNLTLSEPANKQQLLRRATFDLTGLPPTWQEVQEFVNDDSPTAFANVVDRLLDSPAYGERWGRHWLDIARYADTHGGAAIGFKRFPFSYTYRDYVIDAFNKDVPYDQFVLEQLAADQLGFADNDRRLAALGFLTVGMQFRNPHNVIDDQIDVVTRGLMGLTVSCARCHDHKFDAISTQDYYSLYAVFGSSQRPAELPVIGSPQVTKPFQDYESELHHLTISVDDMAREQSEIMRGRLRMQVGLYLREIAKGTPEPDLANADVFSYRTDDLRPRVLHAWQRYINSMPKSDAVFGPWKKLSEISVDGFAVECEQLVKTLRSENGEQGALHKLSTNAPRWNPRVLDTLSDRQSKSMLDVAEAYGKLFGSVHREWLESQLEASLEGTPGITPVPDESEKHLAINSAVNRQLRRHLYAPNSPTSMPDRVASRQLNRPINDNLSGRRNAIHELNLNAAGAPPRAMVVTERAEPDPFFVFVRGNPTQRGEQVEPRFLSTLDEGERPYATGKRRLELAKSIVDPSNPLTRRVVVNWVWQNHFGKGLTRTPDDFGTRGQPPTHPRLLDYLANSLRGNGWSLKQLHRKIMLSQVYQQASVERVDAREVDPNNELLWRMPRQRLSLEAMRDAMLSASGELKSDMGGRPFELLSDPIVPRRSVYAFVNRDIVSPLMSTFDSPNPNACTAKRPETTVPQQTLFALNSDFIQDRAASLARAVMTSADEVDDATNEEKISRLYRRTFSRDPRTDELQLAMRFLSTGTNAEEGKVWQQLAHALLAANEFVFLD